MVVVVRKGKKEAIAARAEILHSFLSKSKGLMFSKRSRLDGTCLVFVFDSPTRISLHMWFVFFPIDVIILDKNKKIVALKKHFMPFTFYTAPVRGQYCIECIAGTVAKHKLTVGDSLDF